MKKVLLTAVVSALLVASCSQEEVVENVSNPQLKTRSAESEVKVEDGILTFSNYEAYRKVYEDLHKLNKDELTVWNQGYTSMLCQESFSPNRLAAEENEDVSEESNEFELDPVRKALYSNRGLLAIEDTIYKVLIGIWGNTFNDEMKWGQGYANVLVNKLAPQTVVAKRVENAKSSYNTDDGIFKLAPEGQFVYGAATGYFDCYKNDVSGEEHYKCHFILN